MAGNIVVPSCNLTFDLTEIANESESHYLLESNYSQHKQQQCNTTTQPNIVHTAARKLVWSAPNNQRYIEMFLAMGEDFCKQWVKIFAWVAGVFPATIQWSSGTGTWIVGVFPAAVQGNTWKGT